LEGSNPLPLRIPWKLEGGRGIEKKRDEEEKETAGRRTR